MKTIEQVEKEHAACFGRYVEYINAYETICEPVDYFKCDYCGFFFEENEIERIGREKFCAECKEKYFDEEEDYEEEYMISGASITEINRIIMRLNAVS